MSVQRAFPLGCATAVICVSAAFPLAAATLATTDPEVVSTFVGNLSPLGFDDITGSGGSALSLVPDAATVDDEYLALGVLISSTGGSAYAATRAVDAVSDPNLLGGTVRNGRGQLLVSWIEPITLDFVVPNTSTPGMTTLVGAWNDPTGSVIRLEVYDAGAALIDSVEGLQGEFVGIATAGIASARFVHVRNQSVGGFTVDDLYFDTPLAVPLPPGALLLLTGAGFLLGRRATAGQR